MSNFIKVRINPELIKPKIKLEYLKNNLVYGFFPITLLNDRLGYCDITGYMKIESLNNISPIEYLTILKHYIGLIENAKDYLFFPDEFIINENNIFIKRNNKGMIIDMKLLYIPEKLYMKEKDILLAFNSILEHKLHSDCLEYDKNIVSYVKNNNYSNIDFLSYLTNQLKEYKSLEKY